MYRAILQATIVSKEELVPSDNSLKITKNNQRIASDSNIADSFVKLVVCLTGKDTSFDKARLPVLQILWGIAHSANLDYASLIWNEFKWHAISRMTKPTKQTKLPYPRFTKLIIDHLLSTNKSLARRSDADMHSEEQDLFLSKLINSVDGVLKFGKDLPDSMINDAIKQSVGYRVYKSKKDQSEKDTDQVTLEEQNVSTIRRGRGKGYICSSYGNLEVNVSSKPKNVVPRRKRTITFADNLIGSEDEAVLLAKLVSTDEQRIQQREIMTQLVLKKEVNKEVVEAYVAEKGKKLKGVATEDQQFNHLLT
ncbi:hypothetical protein Tco_0422265 [Tanacetum coccineum]